MQSMILLIATIGAAVIGAGPLFAQDIAGDRVFGAFGATAAQDGDWTVVTVAPDGSWGLATRRTVGEALAKAIRNCTALSGGQIGCGAQTRTFRSGWFVGLRCGDSNIIAAEKRSADAERNASNREAEMKNF